MVLEHNHPSHFFPFTLTSFMSPSRPSVALDSIRNKDPEKPAFSGAHSALPLQGKCFSFTTVPGFSLDPLHLDSRNHLSFGNCNFFVFPWLYWFHFPALYPIQVRIFLLSYSRSSQQFKANYLHFLICAVSFIVSKMSQEFSISGLFKSPHSFAWPVFGILGTHVNSLVWSGRSSVLHCSELPSLPRGAPLSNCAVVQSRESCCRLQLERILLRSEWDHTYADVRERFKLHICVCMCMVSAQWESVYTHCPSVWFWTISVLSLWPV